MTQDDAFVQAILEAPDDDAPRLIYADWLQEHDDPRGAFIRVQCQLARMAEDDPRRADLEVEEAALLPAMREGLLADKPPAWARKIPAWARKACWRTQLQRGLCEFERGFIARLHTSAAVFLKGAAALLRMTPLQHLHLGGARRSIQAIADCPHLARLRSLDLSGQKLGNQGLAVLLGSPHLGGLGKLDVSWNNVQGEGVRALATTPMLAALTHLDLHYNRVYDAGVEAIASSAVLARLQTLSLAHCQVAVRGSRALARSQTLANLCELDLSDNRIGDAGAEALASASELPALTTLRLGRAEIHSPGARALLTTTRLPRLARLDLSGNQVDTDVWHVAPAPHLLGRLHLTIRNPRPNLSLAGSPLLAACVGLHLHGYGLNDRGAAILAGAPEAAGLRELSLVVMQMPSERCMAEEGMRALTHSPHLAQVRRLSLVGGPLRDPGPALLAALLDSPMARRLTHLDLRSFSLNDNLLALLAKRDALDHIHQLRARNVFGCPASRKAVQERFGPRFLIED